MARPHKLTPDVEARLRELAAQGLTTAQAADVVGLHRNTVDVWNRHCAGHVFTSRIDRHRKRAEAERDRLAACFEAGMTLREAEAETGLPVLRIAHLRRMFPDMPAPGDGRQHYLVQCKQDRERDRDQLAVCFAEGMTVAQAAAHTGLAVERVYYLVSKFSDTLRPAQASLDRHAPSVPAKALPVSPNKRADLLQRAFRAYGLDAMVAEFGGPKVEALMAGRPHGLTGPRVLCASPSLQAMSTEKRRIEMEERRTARRARIRALHEAGVTNPAQIARRLALGLNTVETDLRQMGLTARAPQRPRVSLPGPAA